MFRSALLSFVLISSTAAQGYCPPDGTGNPAPECQTGGGGTPCVAPASCLASPPLGAPVDQATDGCCFDPADALVTTSPATTVASATTTRSSTNTSCVDKMNPLTGVSDCPARASLCTDSVYLAVMQDQCPRTCGFCTNGTSTNTTSCIDRLNPTTGISDCQANRALCTSPIYATFMSIQCPATCGSC